MRKLLALAIGILCAMSLTLSAAEGGKKKEMTEEQKTLWKEMVTKYDANKDGKLDKEERAKMSKEDKQKLHQAMGNKEAKKEHSK